MDVATVTLSGRHIRLEPLEREHCDSLLAAARVDPTIYRWSAVPTDARSMQAYVETAIRWQDEGSAIPFVTVRQSDDVLVGSTRFFDVERWTWPEGYDNTGRPFDACEIGYTWLGSDAIRTAANTEAKLLMLAHAFETWNLRRVCFHTDARNEQSRQALARIGATFEGILRAHRPAVDAKPRDSARFSIVAADWPAIRVHLERRLAR